MAIALKLVYALPILMVTGFSAISDPNNAIDSTGSGAAAPTLKEGIIGTVRHRSGQPVAGAFVQASAADPASGPIPDIAILTDRDGNFVWPLGPGTYRLTLLVDGRKIARADAVVKRGQVTTLQVQAD